MAASRMIRLVGVAAWAATAVGCTTLKVESQPADATVLWSVDGQDWRSWPPNSWQLRQSARGNTTPFSATGIYGDTVLVTVDKEGYRRPLPQVVQLYAMRNEKVQFKLDELPETYAARMISEGYVRHGGQWVRPDEAGLAQWQGEWMPAAEAHRREQLAAGLVEYQGSWYSSDEAAARELADRTAAGFVRFKDRWVKPEVRDAELAVDADVETVRVRKEYPDLPAPRVLGTVPHAEVQLQLYNSTGQAVRFLFSGPMSRSIAVAPYTGVGTRSDSRIILPSGRYEIAVIPSTEDATGQRLVELLTLSERQTRPLLADIQFASWPLAGGSQYSFNYTGSTRSLQDSLDTFEAPEAKLDFEVPEILIPEVQIPEPPENGRRPGAGGAPPGGGGGGRGGGGGGGGGGGR